MNTRCDEYFNKAMKWQEESRKLRDIILSCNLTEEFKWSKPCYMYNGSNIIVLQGFKEYCALLFVKGALLKDTNDILVKPGENTQAGRQIRFTNLKEITDMEDILKSYINEAIEVEKSGLKVVLKETKEYAMPEELENELDSNPSLKEAFNRLTPGRQRAYIIFFSQPKQSITRQSRIEKCADKILDGKGLND